MTDTTVLFEVEHLTFGKTVEFDGGPVIGRGQKVTSASEGFPDDIANVMSPGYTIEEGIWSAEDIAPSCRDRGALFIRSAKRGPARRIGLLLGRIRFVSESGEGVQGRLYPLIKMAFVNPDNLAAEGARLLRSDLDQLVPVPDIAGMRLRGGTKPAPLVFDLPAAGLPDKGALDGLWAIVLQLAQKGRAAIGTEYAKDENEFLELVSCFLSLFQKVENSPVDPVIVSGVQGSFSGGDILYKPDEVCSQSKVEAPQSLVKAASDPENWDALANDLQRRRVQIVTGAKRDRLAAQFEDMKKRVAAFRAMPATPSQPKVDAVEPERIPEQQLRRHEARPRREAGGRRSRHAPAVPVAPAGADFPKQSARQPQEFGLGNVADTERAAPISVSSVMAKTNAPYKLADAPTDQPLAAHILRHTRKPEREPVTTKAPLEDAPRLTLSNAGLQRLDKKLKNQNISPDSILELRNVFIRDYYALFDSEIEKLKQFPVVYRMFFLESGLHERTFKEFIMRTNVLISQNPQANRVWFDCAVKTMNRRILAAAIGPDHETLHTILVQLNERVNRLVREKYLTAINDKLQKPGQFHPDDWDECSRFLNEFASYLHQNSDESICYA